MKLPQSIEELIPISEYATITRDMVEAVAHEACRLQREADSRRYRGGTVERDILATPLVVLSDVDLGDEAVGWAVFNRGTDEARIERIDDHPNSLADDNAAIAYCIAHVDDPKCLLALCETFATDDEVRVAVENNLYRS